MVRQGVVTFVRWSRQYYKISVSAAAARLGLSIRTVTQWLWAWRADRLAPDALGRSTQELTAQHRQILATLLFLMGPRTGVAVLQAFLPGVPRAAIEAYLARYRRQLSRGAHVRDPRLEWRNCGAVWAMDYTNSPTPVDAQYPLILSVRDLGSGWSVGALPVAQATAHATAAFLESLFKEHGAPLVMKCDNGSNLKAKEVRAVLDAYGVLLLASPPETPRYNGACEAGIGSLKTRAQHLATLHGRPGEWTCDDVEGARLMANETARPRGFRGPTPDQMWRDRPALMLDFRDEFRRSVSATEKEVYRQENWLPGITLSQSARDHLARISITSALLDTSILTIWGRRIAPEIIPGFCAHTS